MSQTIGVLMMAYGGPNSLEEVEPYLRDVRGGRETPPHVVEEVRERYRQIGGRSPILERTREQAQALETALRRLDGRYRVYVGMRHWHPFIAEAVAEMVEEGVRRLVALVMAPHYSRMSVGAYFARLEEALAGHPERPAVVHLRSWKDEPGYLEAYRRCIQAALETFPGHEQVHLVFTAHSLPRRILTWDDPYPKELQVTFDALRARFPQHRAHFAYQSAGMSPEPWLGPDAGDLMERLLESGQARAFLVVPIGFVCDHVEVLYDIDIEYRQRVEARGGTLRRVEMPNAAPEMVAGLAKKVHALAQAEGWL